MRSRAALAGVCAVVLLAGCVSTPADPVVDRAIAAASSSVARVIASHCDAGPSAGSAFAIGDDLILTALHVAEGARTVSVRFPGHLPVLADAVGEDVTRDILLLRSREPLGVPALRLAVVPAARGDVLGLLGYPVGGGGVATRQARLSATDFTTAFRGADQQFLRLDAESAGGNSGGAVVDAGGAVQGLMVAVVSSFRPSEASSVVTLALPAADLAERVDRWTAEPATSAVGRPCDEESATRLEPPTLTVLATEPIADEIAQTVWLALAGWNAGEWSSVGQQYTASGRTGLAVPAGATDRVRWLSLEVRDVSRDGEDVTAQVSTRSTVAGDCRLQGWLYGLTDAGGTWLIDSVREVGTAAVC